MTKDQGSVPERSGNAILAEATEKAERLAKAERRVTELEGQLQQAQQTIAAMQLTIRMQAKVLG